jgi:hypothetical protein
MSEKKLRQQRNLAVIAAISFLLVIIVVSSVMYQASAVKPGTSKTKGLNISSVNTASLTIKYAPINGVTPTSTIISSTTPKATALNIFDSTNQQAVTSIATNLDMTPTFTGTVASYKITGGTFDTEIVNDNSGLIVLPVMSSAITPISPLPTLVSGQSVIICSSTTSTSGALFTQSSFVNGQEYLLSDSIQGLTITGTFTDGQSFGPITAGNAVVQWTFIYSTASSLTGASFTSLSVTFALNDGTGSNQSTQFSG